MCVEKQLESCKAALWELEGLKLASIQGADQEIRKEELFWPKIMVNIHWTIRLKQELKLWSLFQLISALLFQSRCCKTEWVSHIDFVHCMVRSGILLVLQKLGDFR